MMNSQIRAEQRSLPTSRFQYITVSEMLHHTASKDVSISVQDSVAIVTFLRPSLTPNMAEHLVQIYQELDRRADVGAIITTGKGKLFCAGADLSVNEL